MTQHLSLLVAGSRGLPTTTQSFLDQRRVQTVRCHTLSEFENQIGQGVNGCVVTDWEFQGKLAVDLLEDLDSDERWVPLVVAAAMDQPQRMVEVMRRGAMAVVELEADDRLATYIWDALQCQQSRAERLCHVQETRRCLADLTPEEHAVLDMICAGYPNKVVAIQLEMGLRTVETRRQRVFRKLKVESLAELIHRVVEADIDTRNRQLRSRRLSQTRTVASAASELAQPRGHDRHDSEHVVDAPQLVAATNALALG